MANIVTLLNQIKKLPNGDVNLAEALRGAFLSFVEEYNDSLNMVQSEKTSSDLTVEWPPAPGSSYGVVDTTNPAPGQGASWLYQKSGGSEQFELYIPITIDDADPNYPPPAIWDDVRNNLGAFTVGDIASISVQTRKGVESSPNFSLAIFTVPSLTLPNDGSFYRYKLMGELDRARDIQAPVGMWNTFSTDIGANRILFNDQHGGTAEPITEVTLDELQAGPVAFDGKPARDYRNEQVKYIAFMTFTNLTDVDASIDSIVIRLKNGKSATIYLG